MKPSEEDKMDKEFNTPYHADLVGNFTEADYLKLIKLSRNPEYADSMVYYRGKVLGRCPAGTTKIGKTCAPAQKDMQATKYKKNVLGGLSRQQVEKLSKAKSTEQIIEAHKEKEKEENDDWKITKAHPLR